MNNLFDLTGKTALVMGATSGMGLAIAEAMGYHGATVIVSSNETTACDEVVREFSAKNIKAFAMPCDMGNKADIDLLVKLATEKTGQIDILVNCVGFAPGGSFLDMSAGEFERAMDINLHSAMYLTQKVLSGMIARKDGALIYIASLAALRGNRYIGLYGVSKAGLVQMARNLAVEFGPLNIRANTISPGLISTPFSRALIENEEYMRYRLAMTPLRRVGQPEEVAGVAVMLASKAGAFITGQTIVVDGGTQITDGS